MGVSLLNRSVRLVFAALFLAQCLLPAQAEPPGKNWLSAGQTVQVDKLQASTPGGSIWASGTILEVNRSSNSYLVEVEGVKMTIINSDKWIKAGAAAGNGTAGTQPANPTAAPAAGTGAANVAGGAAGQFNVGDLVNVDKIMAGSPAGAMWSTGKVVSVNPGMNSVTVQTPDGITRTIVNKPDWIKPGGTPFQQPANQAPANQSPASGAAGKPAASAGTPEWERRKGLGTPPDGEYVVNKAGYGYGLDIGTLTIRGNTYRGIVRGEGASAPYTMDGDHIVWSNGLDGLPAGTKLVSSKYIGADERGRPLIRIYYRGTRGALEVLDAYKVSQ